LHADLRRGQFKERGSDVLLIAAKDNDWMDIKSSNDAVSGSCKNWKTSFIGSFRDNFFSGTYNIVFLIDSGHILYFILLCI
jgi:hypothetical protein